MIWDVEKSLVIKLSERAVVSKAFAGFKELTLEEIKHAYGETPYYCNLKLPDTNRELMEEKGAHVILTSVFDMAKVGIIAQINHLMNEKKIM